MKIKTMMNLARKSVVGKFVLLFLIFIPLIYFITNSNAQDSEKKMDPTLAVSYISEEQSLFEKLKIQDPLISEVAFNTAYKGFRSLQEAQEINEDIHILTIADMSMSANLKRLWIIDLNEETIILNTYVAHGKNSGEEYALQHSNQLNSLQSSPGFYRTSHTYFGKHGLSLKLEGLDTMYNDMAMERAIVLHGAHYVHEDFIKQHQRLGRSWGCPAVPQEEKEFIIETIKDGTCLYLHFNDEKYLASSKWLMEKEMNLIAEEPSLISPLKTNEKNYREVLSNFPANADSIKVNTF